jgi:hypothetical protein
MILGLRANKCTGLTRWARREDQTSCTRSAESQRLMLPRWMFHAIVFWHQKKQGGRDPDPGLGSRRCFGVIPMR